MSKNIIYIGIDVDDNSFHITGIINDTGEVLETKCKPMVKSLENILSHYREKFPHYDLKLCYEATYIGFTLQRELDALGFDCKVVAPSSIPRVHGNQVKTDRVDAGKLAQFYGAGILTFVTVPEEESEQDRDLLRSRQFILHQLSEVRTHIQSLLRKSGIHYKSETGYCSHWTRHHILWLEKKVETLNGSLRKNLSLLVQQMKWLEYTLNEYGNMVDELAQSEKYKKPVNALICYHGIKNIFVMTMITEIGDINRFKHPNQLSSWMGFQKLLKALIQSQIMLKFS